MITARHPVDFAYTREALEALFAYARAHDVERGGRYDARSAAIILWSHHWQHPATRLDSEVIGTFYVQWAPTPTLYAIDTEEAFGLDDLMPALGRLELDALGYVKHGDVPRRPPA
jgi:hypothetical protein